MFARLVLLLGLAVAAAASECTEVSVVAIGGALVYLAENVTVPQATTAVYELCGPNVPLSSVSSLSVSGEASITRWRPISDTCWRANIIAADTTIAVVSVNVTFSPPTAHTTNVTATFCEVARHTHSDSGSLSMDMTHTYVVTLCSPTVLHGNLAPTAARCVVSDSTQKAWLLAVVDDTWSGADDACAHVGMSMSEDVWAMSTWVSCLDDNGIIVRAMSSEGLAAGATRVVRKTPRTGASATSEALVIAAACTAPLIYLALAAWSRLRGQ